MKRLLLFLALVLFLGPAWASAQPAGSRQVTLSGLFDLDGEATDADQIVTVVNLTNAALTIAAQPDVCRRVTITIVDTTPSITAGNTTIVGTDCDGDALTEAIDGSSGAGTYTSTGLFETVTSATNASYATLGGSGDETITVGVAALTAASTYFCAFRGHGSGPGSVFGDGIAVRTPVTTSGSSSTTVAAVTASTNPYDGVDVGDLLMFNISGVYEERLVTAKASATSITINTAITIPAAGIGFHYKNVDCGAGTQDGWIPMAGFDEGTFQLDVDQMNGTGGIDYTIQCTNTLDGDPVSVIGPTNVAAAADFAAVVESRWAFCRAGFVWATNDDATDTGTAIEEIGVNFLGGE